MLNKASNDFDFWRDLLEKSSEVCLSSLFPGKPKPPPHRGMFCGFMPMSVISLKSKWPFYTAAWNGKYGNFGNMLYHIKISERLDIGVAYRDEPLTQILKADEKLITI